MKNEKGFSLIEVLLSIGILGGVIAAISVAVVAQKRSLNFTQRRISSNLDSSLAETIVLNDLSVAGISFGLVRINDDNGLNFFDYYSDIPESQYTQVGFPNTPAARSRTLTLTKTNGAQFLVVIADPQRNTSIRVSPSKAYTYNLTNWQTNPAVTAPATYVGINLNGNISNSTPAGFWANGQGMVLISPALLRPAGTLASGAFSAYAVAPRPHVFAGFINGNSVAAAPGMWGGALDNRNPLDPTVLIPDENNFFWQLPTIGGSAAYTLAVPVIYRRYRILQVNDPEYVPDPTAANQDTMKGVLVRDDWTGTGYGPPFVVADRIDSVIFARNSLSVPVISVRLVMKDVIGSR